MSLRFLASIRKRRQFAPRPLYNHAQRTSVSVQATRLEQAKISTGPNGPETPSTFGLAYGRLKIPSGSRFLDVYLVEAPSTCQPRVALFIFHGVGETTSQWVGVQRLLHENCISSLVFDYSGDGDSSPPGTVRNLHQDAVAAYALFHTRFAETSRVCTLGFSLGNAVMLDAYTEFSAHAGVSDCWRGILVRTRRGCSLLGNSCMDATCVSRSAEQRGRPSLTAIHRYWRCTVMPTMRIQSGWASASTRPRRNPNNLSSCTAFLTTRRIRGPVDQRWAPIIQILRGRWRHPLIVFLPSRQFPLLKWQPDPIPGA